MPSFTPNPNVAAQLANSAQMGAMLYSRAQLGASEAQAIAPVGDPATDPHPGQFRDSIEAVLAVGEMGQQVGRVQTIDPDGAYKEFGTSRTPPHHTLRSGVEATGLIVR